MGLSTIKKIILDQLHDQKGLIAVLVYGSYAKGTARDDSDVDIALLYKPEQAPDSLELWDLHTRLMSALPTEVDLICLNQADPIIGNQVYQNYQEVLVKDSEKLWEYFSRLAWEYAELKEYIKPLEDQILQRRYYVKP